MRISLTQLPTLSFRGGLVLLLISLLLGPGGVGLLNSSLRSFSSSSPTERPRTTEEEEKHEKEECESVAGSSHSQTRRLARLEVQRCLTSPTHLTLSGTQIRNRSLTLVEKPVLPGSGTFLRC